MTSEQGNDIAAQAMTMETPPPYSPPTQQPWQQNQQGQYVQQFMDQNPHEFIQQPPNLPRPMGEFSDISNGYGYNQPTTSQMSTQSTVIVNQPQQAPILIVDQDPHSCMHLVCAVLVCLFCCWPIGIGAIIAAAVSESQSCDKRYEEARKSASIAKVLTLVAFCFGIVVYITVVALISAN